MIAADTLLVGDVVFCSDDGTVNKSDTAADYVAFVGVVVGGTKTGLTVSNNLADVGVVEAADEDEEVIVQCSGVTYVVSAAALAVGVPLQVVTTAGRVDDAVFVAGQTIGIALVAATDADEVIPILIQPK